MNKRRLLVLVSLSIVAIAGTWGLYRQAGTQNPQEVQRATSESTKVDSNHPFGAAPQSTASGFPSNTRGKAGTVQAILENLNHKQIEFYGRVLDQNEQPVADVDVYAAVIYNTGATSGTARKQSKTDNRGNFSIDNMMGRTLDIGLSKEGYKYGDDKQGFQYTEIVGKSERHHPDSYHPVIFHIWKLQGPEPLLSNNRNIRLSKDGTPARLDLTSGKVVSEGGDLIISIHYEVTEADKFDWTLTIGMLGGGILAAEQPFTSMFSAPTGGYTSSWGISMDTKAGQSWRPAAREAFYLRTSADLYGKVFLEVGPNRRDPFGVASIRWSLNPKVGSRILEPKPSEKIINH